MSDETYTLEVIMPDGSKRCYVPEAEVKRLLEERAVLKAEVERLREIVKSKIEGKKLLLAEVEQLRADIKEFRT